MIKDLNTQINDLQALQLKYDDWEDAHDSMIETGLDPNQIDTHLFPERYLSVDLPRSRRELSILFPPTSEIEARVLSAQFSLNVGKLEEITKIVMLEFSLRKLDLDPIANELDHAKLNDLLRLAQTYNKVVSARKYPATLKRHEDKVNEGKSLEALEARLEKVKEFFPQNDLGNIQEHHNGKDEIMLLEELHDARLAYSALHVEECEILLEQAQDVLLQRAHLIRAIGEGRLSPDGRYVDNMDELMDLSAQFGSRSKQLIQKLAQYYSTIQTSGYDAGAAFVTTRFVPMDVSFDI